MIDLLPLLTHPAGQSVSREVDVPDDATTFRVSLARCTALAPLTWPDPTDMASVRIEVFHEQWQLCGAFAAYGGIYVRRDGSIASESVGSGPLPAGVGRKLCVSIDCNRALRTAATLELF